jgi:hypothetical protein
MLRMVSHRRRGAPGLVRPPIPQSVPVPVCIIPEDFVAVPSFHLTYIYIYDELCIPFLLPFQSRH